MLRVPDLRTPTPPPHRDALPPGATPIEWLRYGCPRCGKKNKSPATLAGTVVACARCHGTMQVPSAEPAEPAKPTLEDLSSHVATRSAAKRRRGLPWWLLLAHLTLTLLTLAALWYLHTTGHVPWIDPYLQQLKAWLGRP